MNEAQMHIADTVHTTKGSYSEVLLLSSKQSTVFRFIPIEAEKVAYTTSPVEMQMYEGYSNRTENTEAGRSTGTAPCLGGGLLCEEQLAQGYSFQDAKRLVLEREEEALAYAARQFRAA